MEVVTGSCHAQFPIDHATRVGEARRHAAELARDAGCSDVESGRLALVVTELGTNLLRHAQAGRLLLSASRERGEVEVISIDEGPGIADLQRCLGDGFSTGGTPGTGLGAVRRLAHDFDLHSSVPQGTVVVARMRCEGVTRAHAQGAFRVAALSLAAPGETVCGDTWAACLGDGTAAVMVADGLGHGPDAAKASLAAARVFAEAPLDAPRALLERMHAELRTTRGAAISLFRADEAGLRTASAGNVLGRVVSGTMDKPLLTQHGTAGVQMRTPQEAVLPWPDHAVLVVYSDGIESRWPGTLIAPVLGHDPMLAAAMVLRDHCRGRDDATVLVLARRD